MQADITLRKPSLNILVTGSAGFIGSRVAELLLNMGHTVLGIDSLNQAYDVRLKEWRLKRLSSFTQFTFLKTTIVDSGSIEPAFSTKRLDAVINLAAQAGVRNSVIHPIPYYETNVIGTLNLLELCKKYDTHKFIQASTSSVYGNGPRPFMEEGGTDSPASPYAASKKSSELICNTYHSLHGFDISVLRYFTVYGPAGRPDMAVFRFIHWIYEGKPLVLFGDGSQQRDFTYVDDIALGTISALNNKGFNIINLGSDNPVELNFLINTIEESLNKKAIIIKEPADPSDVAATWANIDAAKRILDWQPRTSLKDGIKNCIDWYLENRDLVLNLTI